MGLCSNKSKDRVFPSKNLAWLLGKGKDTKHIILPLPHYFFHKWNSITDFISFVENMTSKQVKIKTKTSGKIKDL